MQGGIHPDYTGQTYLDVVRAVKTAVPDLHVHAFSPLEVWQGAKTIGQSVPEFLERLKGAGLGTLPGTAAEILDDEVRAIICPDKLRTDQWLDVVAAAHRVGFKTTATIMFGHVDRPLHWARHLLMVRGLQAQTGGITVFVPLAFVHMEAPLYRHGRARQGPTLREAVLMHAVARLALHCLRAGANDLGGTLMNETITRAAGGSHGQEMSPERMEALIRDLGREPWQRTTLYTSAPESRVRASFGAPPLTEIHNRRARRFEVPRRAAELVRPALL
jgi:FO synthase